MVKCLLGSKSFYEVVLTFLKQGSVFATIAPTLRWEKHEQSRMQRTWDTLALAHAILPFTALPTLQMKFLWHRETI